VTRAQGSSSSRTIHGWLSHAALLAVPALALALAAPPVASHAQTTWLCRPGKRPNPCRESLQTTVVSVNGESHVETPHVARRPKIDCFYVYPTVSEQPALNADKSIDPQQTAVAELQAARFSQQCRVFAPIYRQVTLLAGIGFVPAPPIWLAYSDVVDAWRQYLGHYNHGRGVVLIGHSQGAGMLRHLVSQQIDGRPKVRRRLVSAILLGGDVIVPNGRTVGGDFRHVPACSSPRQLGCVIAFSTFNQTPPLFTKFGRLGDSFSNLVSSAFGGPSGPNFHVLCTNPASLSGGSGSLQTLVRTEPFPGIFGFGLPNMYGGTPPTAPTPWLQPQDHYSGQCVQANGADVLMISPVASARQLNPSPDVTWGLHSDDVNIGLGNLLSIVRSEERAYLRGARRSRRKGH